MYFKHKDEDVAENVLKNMFNTEFEIKKIREATELQKEQLEEHTHLLMRLAKTLKSVHATLIPAVNS
jgi:hypothetical protein